MSKPRTTGRLLRFNITTLNKLYFDTLYVKGLKSKFLARLNESAGRAIIVTRASASESGLDVLVKVF